MLFFGLRRAVMAVAAVVLTVSGLLGAYSYGAAYSKHRGFVTVSQLPRAGRGRLLNVHFYSRALHRQAFYLVYLPPGYTRSRHYPVFYLLHGSPGRPQVYIDIANMDVRLDNQLSEGHLKAMILVFPDGRIGGSTYSDSEWANTPSGDFENYVLNVVSDVDSRFSTLPDRQDRVIGGFSAGGYGATNIALHHLPVFGNLEVWSGYFTETRTGVFAHASKADLEYNSPIDYVRGLRKELSFEPLRVFMFVGRDDDDSAQIVPMAEAFARAGANVTYAIYGGGHDWGVWYPRLNQMLILASQDVTHPLRPRRSVPNAARVFVARRSAVRRHPRAVRRRRVHRLSAVPPVPLGPAPPRPQPVANPFALPSAPLIALAAAALLAVAVALRRRRLEGVLLLPVCLLAGIGLLYALRGLGWFAFGPRVPDSLPLLQLAGFDGQPLARVALAWLPIGYAFGLAVPRARPLWLALGAAAFAALLLVAASNASYALAENLRLTAVLWHRLPPLGPWVEAALFALGALLPAAHAPPARPVHAPVGGGAHARPHTA